MNTEPRYLRYFVAVLGAEEASLTAAAGRR
jgi:hypothetical protein